MPLRKRHPDKISNGSGDAGGNNIIIGLVLLQDHVHGPDIIFGMAPVSFGGKVPQENLIGEAEDDLRNTPRDLAGNKSLSADRRFMVEQYTVAGKNIISFPVIHRYPVTVNLATA